MSRHRADSGASLELLLDTICNTFGGVLFLAMLVSLMLAQTRRRQDETRPDGVSPALSLSDLTRLEIRSDTVTAELERLEQAVAAAHRAARSLEVEGAAEMLDVMEAAERQVRDNEGQRARLLAELAALQAAARRAKAEAANRQDDAERLAKERPASMTAERRSLG